MFKIYFPDTNDYVALSCPTYEEAFATFLSWVEDFPHCYNAVLLGDE
jgi:hypothetical protein